MPAQRDLLPAAEPPRPLPDGGGGQCPVLRAASAPADNILPGVRLSAGRPDAGSGFDTAALPDPAAAVRLEEPGGQSAPAAARPEHRSGAKAPTCCCPTRPCRASTRGWKWAKTATVTVEDLGSTNGTQVNGETLVPHVPRAAAGRRPRAVRQRRDRTAPAGRRQADRRQRCRRPTRCRSAEAPAPASRPAPRSSRCARTAAAHVPAACRA